MVILIDEAEIAQQIADKCTEEFGPGKIPAHKFQEIVDEAFVPVKTKVIGLVQRIKQQERKAS